jgi:hypothetical protein
VMERWSKQEARLLASWLDQKTWQINCAEPSFTTHQR